MTENKTSADWCGELAWNENGLLPAVTQDAETGKVLMVAWMNPESLRRTVEEGYAVYWSRSRQKLWRKGEESGNVQRVREIRVDCDSDTLLLMVEQVGGIACHTGRAACFFRKLENGAWKTVDPVLKDPKTMYES